jgi:hypothetical protein
MDQWENLSISNFTSKFAEKMPKIFQKKPSIDPLVKNHFFSVVIRRIQATTEDLSAPPGLQTLVWTVSVGHCLWN